MATLKQSNVNFTLNADVATPYGGKYTNSQNFDSSTGLYNVNQNKLNNIGVDKSFNAVEIDWNEADFDGAPGNENPGTINTTGDLIKAINWA